MSDFIENIKRQKFYYYTTNIIKNLIPYKFYRFQLKNRLIVKNEKQVNQRIQYCISPKAISKPKANWITLKNFKRPKKGSMYFFDLVKHTRYFPINKSIKYKFGDVTENFNEPTIVKSRPIDHNGNSVLMKLDALRHFHFIKDKKSFDQKNDHIVWRGEIHKENRRLLVEKFHDHPLCNIGQVSKHNWYPEHWKKDFLTIDQQLEYKFVLSIEGLDVATNLKWIMSSNSLCFMPKPKFETWFMEGLLIANHHYVLIKDDYSDLIEKRDYYLENKKEALFIIENANKWVKQFKDKENEKKLSLLVLNKYFEQTGQN